MSVYVQKRWMHKRDSWFGLQLLTTSSKKILKRERCWEDQKESFASDISVCDFNLTAFGYHTQWSCGYLVWYLHAGAAYQVRNRRLFIAITSKITVYKLRDVEVVSV